MKSRVLFSSYVIDFLDIDFNSNLIEEIIKDETDEVLQNVKDENLEDWEVVFLFRFNNTERILISKNRFGSVASQKQKEIIIHIPIPMKDVVSWGVNNEQHVYKDATHLNHLMNNFNTLEVDFNDFNNRTDYIIDSARRVVKFCFENGFTVNGVKILKK
ncbi:Imm9 family immunity protein [Flavobacterium gawalongense]|uniref:Uncharacterized protein n=1 Tax=Flavobacterium gawalongense TaxID=2594432 RepID=A0A553BN21_9FLAO|nr:Imm9 family immunity protein [Flavobacterium gawalongense]TRX00129.1 hypothetical protein FNW33_13045 [Flavobacterium gawalongense]TRX04877.1 hypothetical protein FNW12_12520 [Flavobacterium gawalongense]TRX09653.1 hypothetical protein FNW11_09115 [Flavobacterium gawalongense]TRX10884.1 hypothetical protein FNW10_09010 [Flavobacterium gawalongense]TRX28058.1 hypothetical protein FNW38_08585 [Flavobacterium gawalongense]